MPHDEYLRTPEWQDKRHAALERARLAASSATRLASLTFTIGHNERRGNDEGSDPTVICSDCHHISTGTPGWRAEGAR